MNILKDCFYTIIVCVVGVLLLLFTSVVVFGDVPTESEYRHLLDAIRIVETGGAPNNGRDAVGDNGQSIGPYQIQEAYWKDATEFDRTIGGEYHDVRDIQYAERVILAYWKRYATERRIGRPVTFEDLARIHNGGPNGFKRNSTVPYWNKVKKILNSEETS